MLPSKLLKLTFATYYPKFLSSIPLEIIKDLFFFLLFLKSINITIDKFPFLQEICKDAFLFFLFKFVLILSLFLLLIFKRILFSLLII